MRAIDMNQNFPAFLCLLTNFPAVCSKIGGGICMFLLINAEGTLPPKGVRATVFKDPCNGPATGVAVVRTPGWR